MSITPADVLQVARLAELEVAPADVTKLAGQLDKIVTYVGQLEALGATAGTPSFQPGPKALTLAPDVVGSVPLERPPAEFAPDFRDGLFVVPRMPALEGE
jgi:aspartyl-tRNA(Asn)/glutamyl-tRNA(Gln) amidotransferase subunit C